MGCKCVRSGFEQDNNEIIKTPDQKKRINNIIKANIPLKNKKKRKWNNFIKLCSTIRRNSIWRKYGFPKSI